MKKIFVYRVGSDRMVFLIGPFAFKLISVHMLWKFILRVAKITYRGQGWFVDIKYDFLRVKDLLKFSIQVNLEERICWKRTRAEFLAPTYCSFGIINVQKRIYGSHPGQEESIEIYKEINRRTNWLAVQVDPHNFIAPGNYIKTKCGRYVLVDYGNPKYKPVRANIFFQRYAKEIDEILSKCGK